MSLLKTILDFYIRSSLHVAVCFVALAMVFTETVFTTPELLKFNFLQFCLILCAYNFIKYFVLVINKKSFRFKNSIVWITVIFGIMGLILLIPELPFIYPFVIAMILLVLLYTFPLILKKNLRSFTILKLPIIGLCWTILIASLISSSHLEELRTVVPLGVTICFGGLPAFLEIGITIIFLFLSIFFFVQALCIPFEIRDVKYDKSITDNLAKFLGVRKTKALGYLFLILSFVFYNIYWNWSSFIVSPYGLTEIIIFVVTALSIFFSDKFKSDYYASFFVEAIPLLWLGLYLVL